MSDHDEASFYDWSEDENQSMDVEGTPVFSPAADVDESRRSRASSVMSEASDVGAGASTRAQNLRLDDVSPLCAFMRNVNNERDVEKSPPVFCCPFWLREGRFPLLAKKLLWLLCDIKRFCEGKTKNVFLAGVPGTHVVDNDGICSAMSYNINRHMDLNGFNIMLTVDEMNPDLKSIPAFDVQLRVVQAGRHQGGDSYGSREQYLLVMVFCAPCFNLRTAVWETLYCRPNDPNLQDRRVGWQEVIFHSQNFAECYNEMSMEIDVVDNNADLLLKERLTHITLECFTLLFSVPRSLDAITRHVAIMRSFDQRLVFIEGFGRVGEQRESLMLDCLHEIRNYELSWNMEMERYNLIKKKKKTNERASSGASNAGDVDRNIEETLQTFRANLPSSPVGIGTDGVMQYVIPNHTLTVKFVCDVFTEKGLNFNMFNQRWRGLPHSVNIVVLQRCLKKARHSEAAVNLDGLDPNGLPVVENTSDCVSQSEWYNIVRGGGSKGQGTMFRQSFSGWQKYVRGTLRAVPSDQRYDLMCDYMQQGVLLAIMHADGSDGCEFGRLKTISLAMSDSKKRRFIFGHDLFWQFIDNQERTSGYVWDSHVSHALHFLHSLFGHCNEGGFRLKEYNFFLLFLLCCRQVVGLLDQSNNRVVPAPKCCGLMIWVRNGPFARYDEKLKCVVDVYAKRNGTGLDTVVDLFRNILMLEKYSGYEGCGRLQLVPLDTTSAYGLKVECSDKYKSGSLVGTVNQFGQTYALTEMNVPDNNEGLMFMGALVHIVKGSLSVEEASVTKSTVANANGGERETYEWVLAVPFLATIGAANFVGERCLERVKTLLCISRALTASSGGSARRNDGLLGYVNEKSGQSGFGSVMDRDLFKVYIDSLGLSLGVAYMQRQSIIDKVHASSVCTGILDVFLSCLKRSTGILNPSYVSDLQFSRSVQTAQTYGVSLSLLVQSVDEILRDTVVRNGRGIDASSGNDYYRLMKNVALRFGVCGLELPILPCVLSDLTESMLRQDFFHLLGIFACEMKVPCFSEKSMVSFFKNGQFASVREKSVFDDWVLRLQHDGCIFTSEKRPTQMFLSLPAKDVSVNLAARENASPQVQQGPKPVIKSIFQSTILLAEEQNKNSVVRQVGRTLYLTYRKILEESCNMQTEGELINTLFNCVDACTEFPKFYGRLHLFGNSCALLKGDKLRSVRSMLQNSPSDFAQGGGDYAFHWIYKDKIWNLAVDFRWLIWWSSIAGNSGMWFGQQSIGATCTFRVVRSLVQNFLVNFVPAPLFPAQVIPMGIPKPDTARMMCIDFTKDTGLERPEYLQRPEQSFSRVVNGKFVGYSEYMSGLIEDVNCGERTLAWKYTHNLARFSNVPVDLSPPPIPSDVWIPGFTVNGDDRDVEIVSVYLASIDNTMTVRVGGKSEKLQYRDFFATTGVRLLPWLYRSDIVVRVEDSYCVIMEFKHPDESNREDLDRPRWTLSQLFDPDRLCYYVSSKSSYYRGDAQHVLSPIDVVEKIVKVGTVLYVRCSAPGMEVARRFLYTPEGVRLLPVEINDNLLLQCHLAWDGNFVRAQSYIGDGIESMEEYDNLAWVHVAASIVRVNASSWDRLSFVKSETDEVVTLRVPACYLVPQDVVQRTGEQSFQVLSRLCRLE